jgi:hypothetical protein
MKGVVQTKFFIVVVVLVVVLISYCKDTTKILFLQAFSQLFSEIIIIFLIKSGTFYPTLVACCPATS